jgi:hypothetical protein
MTDPFSKMYYWPGVSRNDYKFLAKLEPYPGIFHIHNKRELWHELEDCMENNWFPYDHVEKLLEHIPRHFPNYLQSKIDEYRRDIWRMLPERRQRLHACFSKNKFLSLLELFFRVKFEREWAMEVISLRKKETSVKKWKIFLKKK